MYGKFRSTAVDAQQSSAAEYTAAAACTAASQMLRDLTGRLQHMDAETLLLLALLWILWQEKANPRLLLALAYIAL